MEDRCSIWLAATGACDGRLSSYWRELRTGPAAAQQATYFLATNRVANRRPRATARVRQHYRAPPNAPNASSLGRANDVCMNAIGKFLAEIRRRFPNNVPKVFDVEMKVF